VRAQSGAQILTIFFHSVGGLVSPPEQRDNLLRHCRSASRCRLPLSSQIFAKRFKSASKAPPVSGSRRKDFNGEAYRKRPLLLHQKIAND
jgi:hypothetical protein